MNPKVLDIENTQKEKQERLSLEQQKELAEKAKNCDQEAWGKIYKAYRKSILGFFRFKVYDKSVSEDLSEDTFLLAYENLKEGQYDPKYSFSTYLFSRRIIIWKRYLKEIMKEKGREQQEQKQDRERKRKQEQDQEQEQEFHLKDVDLKETLNIKGEEDLEEENTGYDKFERISFKKFWMEVPPQDEDLIRLEVLRLTNICCAKPHQLISLHYVKFLEWKPKEVVKELSDTKLEELAEKFLNDYLETFDGRINKEILLEYYSDLYKKLDKFYYEIYTESEYGEKGENKNYKKVKDYSLRDFYGNNPEASLLDWCYKVKERTKKLIQKGILCFGGM